ncbi:hypothetical protein M8J75_014888 [Diaphorina citri]|nr:hypothetical protein M8J75_014888 [Diaphorina citri]
MYLNSSLPYVFGPAAASLFLSLGVPETAEQQHSLKPAAQYYKTLRQTLDHQLTINSNPQFYDESEKYSGEEQLSKVGIIRSGLRLVLLVQNHVVLRMCDACAEVRSICYTLDTQRVMVGRSSQPGVSCQQVKFLLASFYVEN